MSKPEQDKNSDEMLDYYDFSNGVRGKYVDRFPPGSKVVVLAPDVAEVFPDAASVNEALRSLQAAREPAGK